MYPLDHIFPLRDFHTLNNLVTVMSPCPLRSCTETSAGQLDLGDSQAKQLHRSRFPWPQPGDTPVAETAAQRSSERLVF